MIRNIFILAYRYLIKYKVHTSINIIGLAVGFTAYILVSLFINYEYTWDKHNTNYERIYRAQRHFVKAKYAMNGNNISPHSSGITAKLLYPRYPEIEKTVILKELDGLFISSDSTNPIFDNNEGFSSEQSILQVFTYHFISGDKNTALIEPYSIVLSETMAHKLFPNGNAVGNTVMLEKKYALKVTGVYSDLPENSVIRPCYIVSLSTLEKRNEDVRNTMSGIYMTYVLLKPNQDVNALNQKIWNLFHGYTNAEDEKIKLCPLAKLHLSFNDQTAYLTILYLYQLIGIFILLLAAFNYINLTTANISVRAKETGIRKVNGSSQWLLTIQFLGETLVVAIIAINFAFFLTELFLPTFNYIVQKQLTLSYSTNGAFILRTAGIALLTGLIAGVYPAFFMSSQKEVDLFKGNLFKSTREKFPMKKLLVTLQFSISMFLIIVTLSVVLQVKYLATKELGLNKENILYAPVNVTSKNTNFDVLRNRMLQHPEMINCSMSHHAPFVTSGGNVINWEGCMPGDILEIRDNDISYDFIKNFDITIIEGRSFSREFPGDIGNTCLINETAMRSFGYQNPIGKRLGNGRLRIIGVMKDYHYKDMYNTIEPAVLRLASDTIRPGKWIFSFRVRQGQFNEARKSINRELSSFFPNDPFEIRVLSETFRSENVFKILDSVNSSLLFFTVLNIFLAIIGLLGLVSFATQRRTKEIGVRKINGGSSFSIFLLLTKEYFFLLLIATIISWPCGYLAFTYIPANYKISTPYWVFVFATVIVVIIALATSFYHTAKAAGTNPAASLRYE
ncbi:MAG TPA: ABC transporter permease [Bacteroidales bacterium]